MTTIEDPPAPTPGSLGEREAPHGGGPVTCTARAKSTGERCQRAPIRGGTVCYVHGGGAPGVKAAAARRLEAAKVERDVRDAIAFESLEGVMDPLASLSRLADESLAMKEALAARINDLSTKGRLRYKAAGTGTEQLRAEVQLYERALDRSAKFLDLLARSGFEERRVALQEAQGQLVAQAVRGILAGMLAVVVEQLRQSGPMSADVLQGVQAAWSEAVPVVVPRELRALQGGDGR